MIDLRELTIAEFIRITNSGVISLSEFYGDLISFIQKRDSELHAFEAFDPALVRQRAAQIEKAARERSFYGRLCGAPIAVKDVINTAELPTERGSAYWKGYQAGNNARVVDEMLRQGSVNLGKTVTAELAVHHPGETVNPHNPRYTPGTSSMGSAVAVSAGMALAALGTQTGSSIIRPASYTGVFGFKPSYGVIPRTGVLKTTDTLDHVGFFANHIEDIHLLFDTLRVRGSNYPVSDATLAERFSAKVPATIGVLKPQYLWKNYKDYVKEAFENLMNALSADSGLNVEQIKDDGWFDASHRIHGTLYDKSLSYYFKKESQNRKIISSTLASMVDHGNAIGAEEFQKALSDQESMQKEFDRRFERYDVIFTPSTANIAPLRDPYKETDDTGLIWSLLGAPSLSVPVFTGPDNMPFGLQAVGVKYSDYRVLSLVAGLCQKKLLCPQSGVKLSKEEAVLR